MSDSLDEYSPLLDTRALSQYTSALAPLPGSLADTEFADEKSPGTTLRRRKKTIPMLGAGQAAGRNYSVIRSTGRNNLRPTVRRVRLFCKQGTTQAFRPSDAEEDAQAENLIIIALSVADSFELHEVASFFDDLELGEVEEKPDVVHIRNAKNRSDIWVFWYGCICFANIPRVRRRQILEELRQAIGFESHTIQLDPDDQKDSEMLFYTYDNSPTFSIKKDVCHLTSEEDEERAAIAFALSQCSKLNTFERRVQHQIDQSAHLPNNLARTGSVQMSLTEIGKIQGQIYLERNTINMHCDVLETPEFFWESPQYLTTYEQAFSYLELHKRLGHMNKRLEMLKDMFDLLADQIQYQHTTRLEWIVVILIVIETLVMIVEQVPWRSLLDLF